MIIICIHVCWYNCDDRNFLFSNQVSSTGTSWKVKEWMNYCWSFWNVLLLHIYIRVEPPISTHLKFQFIEHHKESFSLYFELVFLNVNSFIIYKIYKELFCTLTTSRFDIFFTSKRRATMNFYHLRTQICGFCLYIFLTFVQTNSLRLRYSCRKFHEIIRRD